MPARLCDIARAAKTLGIAISKPNGGSHWKATRPGFRPYPLPAHNGDRTELDDKYIRGLCRAMQVDEGELRALL